MQSDGGDLKFVRDGSTDTLQWFSPNLDITDSTGQVYIEIDSLSKALNKVWLYYDYADGNQVSTENAFSVYDRVYLFENEDTKHWFHLWVFPRFEWMEEFGQKVESVRPIINYAKEKMNTPKVREEVKEFVRKMRDYMRIKEDTK